MIKRWLLVPVVLAILGCAHSPRSLQQNTVSNVLAKNELVKMDAIGANVPALLKAAESGNADAQNSLGVLYLNGNGVPADHEEALLWTEKAAERGNLQAQLRLGEISFLESTKMDAFFWIPKRPSRVIHGFVASVIYYGFMAEKEMKESNDYSKIIMEAKKWFLKAAEQGSIYAQMRLGDTIIFNKHDSTHKDGAEALSWYLKAAEQGDVMSQYKAGEIYYGGVGVSTDWKQAVSLYRKAAESGLGEAQYKLGFIYSQGGSGVEKDLTEGITWYTKALPWLHKAAESGLGDAQVHLGYIYRNGYGVEKDRLEAIKWYTKALKNNNYSPMHDIRIPYKELNFFPRIENSIKELKQME